MRVRTSQFVRLVVLIVLVIGLAPQTDRDAIRADDAADAITQVRLRKLHLVRPDLIPYPISFEVYA